MWRELAAAVGACLVAGTAWPETIVVPAGATRVTDVSRFAAGVAVPESVTDVGEVATRLESLGERPNLCGMRVVARATAANGTRTRWELLFSVVGDDGHRIGGLWAGAFAGPRDAAASVRVSRASVALGTPGAATDAVPVEESSPADGGFVGVLPEAVVVRVWEAIDVGAEFTVDLTYSSGARETLRLRTLGSQAPAWYRGRNSPAQLCLRVLAPASGPVGPLREVQRTWSIRAP